MSSRTEDEIEAARLRANALRRARRAANPEKAAAERARQRELDAAAPGRLEARRARNAEYMRNRAEGMKEQRKAYSAANSAQVVARVAKWRLANRGRFLVQQQNSRARGLGIDGSLSPGIADALYVRQGGKCTCCGASLEAGYEIDHIISLHNGGPHSDSNVQLMTPRCNGSKGKKNMDEYLLWIERNRK